MKKVLKSIFLLLTGCFLFFSCKTNNISTQITKTVGTIEVTVDPNVELMMILARLSNVPSFQKGFREQTEYLTEVDDYFGNYDLEPAVDLVRRSGLREDKIPEFGMYMNEDSTGYRMKLNNKYFITNVGPASKYPFYALESNMEAIRSFRIESDFDTFFTEHKPVYEQMIDDKIEIILNSSFTEWYENFYGKKEKNNLCIYLTNMGGNFGISYKNSKGEIIPKAVILASFKPRGFINLLAHEFSHPKTREIVQKLYENSNIADFFDHQFNSDSSFYVYNEGLTNGYSILNEVVTQACANKYLEDYFSKEDKESADYYNITCRKLPFVLETAEFMENYETNRTKYKTLDDFYPELERFIVNLISEVR